MKKKMLSMAAIGLSLMNLTACSEDLTAKMSRAGMNTGLGMGIVFAVLIFICIIIWLMGFIPKLISGEKTEKPVKKEKPVSSIDRVTSAIVANETADLSGDLELVAVITAAIMASLGDAAPADGLVVRSIKKRNTHNWKKA